jgi:hypothetical protein
MCEYILIRVQFFPINYRALSALGSFMCQDPHFYKTNFKIVIAKIVFRN